LEDEQAAELIRGFNLARLSPAFLDDPYPTYTALRDHAPIHRLPDGSFFLTRYDDVAQVYRDTATWSSDKKIDFKPAFADSLLYEHHTTSLVFNDPPVHTRVRNSWRRYSRRARSGRSSLGSRRWSIGCWTTLLSQASST